MSSGSGPGKYWSYVNEPKKESGPVQLVSKKRNRKEITNIISA